MKNKGYIPILFVLLFAFTSFSFLTNSNEKLIKNFTLKSVDNKKVSLNDYKDANLQHNATPVNTTKKVF